MDPDFLEAVESWPGTYWILLLALVSMLNIRNRVEIERKLGWPSRAQVPFPEKQWNYEAQGLRDFVRAVGGPESPALQDYVKHVLRFSDICFAIGLAGTTAYLWYWIATMSPPVWLQWAYPLLGWLAAPLGAMAIIYGVSDVAEDLKLAHILRDADRIDPAEASAANLLTRIKIGSLAASSIGLALFVPIGAAHDLVARMKMREKQPGPTGT